MSIDLEPLREVIREHGLMEKWKDSIFDMKPTEQKERAVTKANQAKDEYIRIMSSPKNDHSVRYRAWAVKTALGIVRVDPHRVKTKSHL